MQIEATDARLVGTILTPNGPVHATVVFFPGSGSVPRFGTHLFPFERLFGEELARQGIRSLFYDKRGVGKSSGDSTSYLQLPVLLEDARTAQSFLRQRISHDGAPLCFASIGHSEGFWLAADVAARDSTMVAVVGLAGSVLDGVSGLSARLPSNPVFGRHPKSAAAPLLRFLNEAIKTVYAAADTVQMRESLALLLKTTIGNDSSLTPALKADMAELIVSLMPVNAFHIIHQDPTSDLRSMHADLLTVFGGKDPLVPLEPNMAALKSLRGARMPRRSDTLVYPNLDHAFQSSGGNDPLPYLDYNAGEIQAVARDISRWIIERCSVARKSHLPSR